MEIVFRNFKRDQEIRPGNDEIYLVPQDPNQWDCRRITEFVINDGFDALIQGIGPIQRIIAPVEPKLDDMIAAEILIRCLTVRDGRNNQPSKDDDTNNVNDRTDWLESLRPFARYAALVRSGLRPTSFPLENCIDGIFLALCGRAWEFSADDGRYSRLLADWQPLAERIFSAASQKIDPFQQDIVSAGHVFAEARSYLQADQRVYRQDVAAGRKWNVSIPPGRILGSALVLKDPKSLLFKHWCRVDSESPNGRGYLLLVVFRQKRGQWVISTDPVQRISLHLLVHLLQQSEHKNDPDYAKSQPWYDGKPFAHSLIAAPRDGSHLPEAVVLKTIRQWCGARDQGISLGSRLATAVINRKILVGSTAALVLITVVIGLIYQARPPMLLDTKSQDRQRGVELVIEKSDWSSPLSERVGRDLAVIIVTDEYQSEYWSKLSNPVLDGSRIGDLLKLDYRFGTELMCNPSRDDVLTKLRSFHGQTFSSGDQLLIYIAGHGAISGPEGFLVFQESQSPRLDKNWSTYLAHSQLRDIIEKIDCPHVMVVLDICFGSSFDFGGAMRGSEAPGIASSGVYRAVSKPEFVQRKLNRPGRLWMTSGARQTVPDGIAGQHSPFARQFIEALESHGGDDSILTFYEMWTHVELISGSEPRSGTLRNHEAGGDFIFISQSSKSNPPAD